MERSASYASGAEHAGPLLDTRAHDRAELLDRVLDDPVAHGLANALPPDDPAQQQPPEVLGGVADRHPGGRFGMNGVEVFVTAGLGDNSYLVSSEGEAAVVDPQRDAWHFLRAADTKGVRIRAVLETHVHNDYVSGAHELRAATGAELVVPAKGRYQFPHRPAADGHEVRIGDLRLVALATPGHTPEHLAWLVYQGDATTPSAVFTGGSLLVGSAGRTDLLGPELAGELTKAQFASIRKLGALPDEVEVLPTHGAGSFCVAAMPA